MTQDGDTRPSVFGALKKTEDPVDYCDHIDGFVTTRRFSIDLIPTEG